jgi:Transposase DDE domain
MTGQERVYQWTEVVRSQLPHLSKPQATVLALWSLGMVVARSCALTAVGSVLAGWLARKPNTVRQQLREFVYEREAKRGAKRQPLVVRTCFRPLLAWVLAGYPGPQLALALDATTLGDRFVVLAVSVVYRGCAIPVAWTVLPAGVPHAWRQEWLTMLRLLWRAVPRDWTVVVLADRGLYARWLYRRIVRLGWHPFLRVNLGGSFRRAGQDAYRPLRTFAPTVGTEWAGRGTASKGRPRALDCTLLARWEAGYADPWLILTDLPPAAADAAWYGMRAWIEQGFKLTKRAGFQWQRTRITDPARAERLWLAVAVATLWLVRVGGAADAALATGTLADLTPAFTAARRPRRATQARLVGVFRRGWVLILVALLDHAPLPLGALVPEPWPTRPALPHRSREAAA